MTSTSLAMIHNPQIRVRFHENRVVLHWSSTCETIDKRETGDINGDNISINPPINFIMRTLGVSIDEWHLLLVVKVVFFLFDTSAANVFDDNNTRRNDRRTRDLKIVADRIAQIERCNWTKWTRRSSLKWERRRLDSGIPRDGASRGTCWWSGSRLWWISRRLWGRPICRARLTRTDRWGRSRWPRFMAVWYSAIYFYRHWS